MEAKLQDGSFLDILIIGDKNLRTESINEIIRNELEIEAEHITPDTFYARSAENIGFDRPYRCVMLDLASFSSSPQVAVKLVRESVETEKLVVSNIYMSESQIKSLLPNGADDYLSRNTPPSQLPKVIG